MAKLSQIQNPVSDLLLEVAHAEEFHSLLKQLRRGQRTVRLSGLTRHAKALYAVLLQQLVDKPLLYIARSNDHAEVITDLLAGWSELLGGKPPSFIPAHDVRPYQGLSPHPEIAEKRAVGLGKLAAGQVSLVVAPIASVATRLQSPDFYRRLLKTIQLGQTLPLEQFVDHLVSVGYTSHEPVEMAGQFSVRGGIVDVFSPESLRPVRLELLGDDVESIREFDPEMQRSVGQITSATLLPVTEFPLRHDRLNDLYRKIDGDASGIYSPGEPFAGWEFLLPLAVPFQHSLMNLCDQAVIFLDEPQDLEKELERLLSKSELEYEQVRELRPLSSPPSSYFLQWQEITEKWDRHSRIIAEEIALAPLAGVPHLECGTRPSPRYHGNVSLCLAEIKKRIAENFRILVLTTGRGETERLGELFAESAIPFATAGTERTEGTDNKNPICWIAQSHIPDGVTMAGLKIMVLGYQDIFDAPVSLPIAKSSKISTFLSDFRDLEPGDFIVHKEHGVGCFRGLKEISQDDIRMEFMEVAYAEEARLYVPLARLDLVQKYRGMEGAKPKLDRLGGSTWARTKKRVRKAMEEMAGELLKLYAGRKLAQGFAFSSEDHWQREFDEAFEFEETADQLKAIEDVKQDMKKAVPMERLVCGDVGYGKTEVAMRAAFRAASHSKQVAVLAPTTILALQHLDTFQKRFAAFPLRIDMLSRFKKPAQQKEALKNLEKGKIDIIIGTHRLLSKDVVFHDLGLLIVDEEQRFGVRHKERLKEIKKSVDILSLSATPIPRTLHMALVGLRDMSVIETPPRDRLSIQTVVAPFSDGIIKTAIEQELDRGGQVYFVHNRVGSLDQMAARIKKLVPQARIALAHGQMNERHLEKVMLQFVRQETNVLVATTIIENGLDIPLVNTIVINRSDRMGLSELYQLRGRVGRSNRRAYAYLLVPDEGELSELARRRLSALKEFTELGSGFRVAALDMELRGAGNLLGREQHGEVNAVGFELYCRMMEETIQQMQGTEVPQEVSTSIQLGIDIRIPPSYIPEEHQRLQMYKMAGNIRSAEEKDRLQQELEDRYGPLSAPVKNLLAYSELKFQAERLWIRSIDRKGGHIHMQFHPSTPLNSARLIQFISRNPGVEFTPAGLLRVPLHQKSGGALAQAKSVLDHLQ